MWVWCVGGGEVGFEGEEFGVDGFAESGEVGHGSGHGEGMVMVVEGQGVSTIPSVGSLGFRL